MLCYFFPATIWFNPFVPSENTEHRKLAAIMFTDMVGYSAFAAQRGADEKSGLRQMSAGTEQRHFPKAHRLGPYEIGSSIGAGGMGEVFRARDTRLNPDVAVKVLPRDFVADADRLRRFEQEAKTLAALNHPNVLTIHDAVWSGVSS